MKSYTKRKRVVAGPSEAEQEPDQPVVAVIDGEEIPVPEGKLLLSKELVDKILSIERRPFPHLNEDLLDEQDDKLREASRQLGEAYEERQDKLVECQAMIRMHCHEKGYAMVDDEFEVRVAIYKALNPFPYHVLNYDEEDA